jgi:aminomuconate-semialdehyde/2-hydroxymuconate-6-semialdehyde dehydrogenase
MSMTTKSAESARSVQEALNSKLVQHFIGGKFVSSKNDEMFDDINPATGEVIAKVSSGGAAEVDMAVAAAKEAFDNGPWPHMSIRERCEILRKIGDLILQYREVLAHAETRDTGKPLSESFDGDIPRSAQNFHFFSEYAQAVSEECFTVSENERHLAVR